MSRRIVLVSAGARYAPGRLRPLADDGFELVARHDLDALAEADALAAGLAGAWATVAGSERYSRALLERLDGFRAIARVGVGYDTVDVAAATEHGVAVLTTPGANADAVADWALTLMLAAIRRLRLFEDALRGGGWRPDGLAGDLAGATVAVVGLGAIGRGVARRLAGFGCRLLGVDPLAGEVAGVERVELAEALPQVDVLTLHAPLLPETRHLIGERELALLRPQALLVNTARGPLVDERALVAALEQGHLGGAALDVYEQEPLALDHPLRRLPNVVLTGHVAGFTRGSTERMLDAVVANLRAVAAGRVPPGCVNPDALG